MHKSQLYTFLDAQRIFVITFFEGQKLISDLATQQPPDKFSFMREAMLGTVPLLSLLKLKENFGFYFDADSSKLSLKIEVKSDGKTRCALTGSPSNNKKNLQGTLRILKHQPHQETPYTSHIAVDQFGYEGLINQALKESFQFETTVIISKDADQSFLISRLPISKTEAMTMTVPNLENWVAQNKPWLTALAKKGLQKATAINKTFLAKGFSPWLSRDITLYCDCSLERFSASLTPIYNNNRQDLFSDDAPLEIVCQYCYKRYLITEETLRKIARPS